MDTNRDKDTSPSGTYFLWGMALVCAIILAFIFVGNDNVTRELNTVSPAAGYEAGSPYNDLDPPGDLNEPEYGRDNDGASGARNY